MPDLESPVLFWFRRDLRLHDNCGLFHALSSGRTVIGCFVFDTNILDQLEDDDDARVTFLHQAVNRLQSEIQKKGGDLYVLHGQPEVEIPKLASTHSIQSIFTNHDDEPYARKRDALIRDWCHSKHISFHTFKDHHIFERDDVLKPDGKPYTVFTPYSKTWKNQMVESGLEADGTYSCFRTYASSELANWKNTLSDPMPTLEDLGFQPSSISFPDPYADLSIIQDYNRTRDIPSIEGTTRLGIHFRFGTISIREHARLALASNEVYLNELIWRDFYAVILCKFPHVVNGPFRVEYDQIEWRNNEAEFNLWCEGKTGYPLVDAGMRQLNQTGWMHNRVRMVVASFLAKHLLIDWRWGEHYFARKLLDYDLASNNGGWQWAAGCGTDAAPYFRIFNPTAQQKRFDPEMIYIRTWVPEIDSPDYPVPIVDHNMARERCLIVYRNGLNSLK